MRHAMLSAAILLAACSSGEGNLANQGADANFAGNETGSQAASRASAPGNGADMQPPAAPPGAGNDQAPAPAPPDNGTPAPEPSGQVTLRAAPARVAPGGNVSLTLANGSSSQIGYNLCTSALLTAAGAEVRTDRVCTLELRTLEPGRAATYSYQLPERIAAGRYRFRTGIDRMPSGGGTSVRSNLIEVR